MKSLVERHLISIIAAARRPNVLCAEVRSIHVPAAGSEVGDVYMIHYKWHFPTWTEVVVGTDVWVQATCICVRGLSADLW